MNMRNIAFLSAGMAVIAFVSLILFLQSGQASAPDVEQDQFKVLQTKENILDTQTPEQTMQIFLSFLDKGDLSSAVKDCVVVEEQGDIMSGLVKIQAEGLLNQMIDDLQDIVLDFQGDNLSSYHFTSKEDGEEFGHTVIFQRDEHGVWLIKSL